MYTYIYNIHIYIYIICIYIYIIYVYCIQCCTELGLILGHGTQNLASCDTLRLIGENELCCKEAATQHDA